jgi:hypothetical protein
MTRSEANWQAQSRVHEMDVGRRTGWAGWVTFAGVMLALLGLFHVMAGFSALFQDEVFAVRPSGLLVHVSYDTWGWVYILLGVVAIATASLLLRGNMVGRVLAVVIASLSALANLAFLNANPWWAVLAIAFNVVVIFAVTVHGGELKNGR